LVESDRPSLDEAVAVVSRVTEIPIASLLQRGHGQIELGSGGAQEQDLEAETALRIPPKAGAAARPVKAETAAPCALPEGVSRVKIDEIPEGLANRSPTGRLGSLWMALLALPAGEALHVVAKSENDSKRLRDQLRAKGREMKSKLEIRRTGKDLYAWLVRPEARG
jgi:hypothetical protein